ncbi:G-type lectin S-receptor-like serine/threonine-protein kinase LECRK1 [Vitis vinifera]|uniref:non-specific serine/threonine protein kinase n=2 Tax=Vitis vinifera TaxID=29760 RepID=A0A438HLM5_VITVI|nr:G-type lectin S-receptor-like serine/threonine-protein kinase LECRK1 [Vitis vinifera]
MASVWFVFFLPLLCVGVRAQPEKTKLISLNSSLSPKYGSPIGWASPSGLFAFGFYPQGSGFSVGIWLVGTDKNTVVWTANRDDPPASANAKLYFTEDGKLLLQTEEGSEISITDGSGPAVAASMLDSGSFVLYDQNLSVIWNSFSYPTDTILGGQNLDSDNKIVSSESRSNHSSGWFFLAMQEDGNLVSYPVNSSAESDDAYWSSGTSSATQLSLNTEGALYLSSGMSSSIIRTFRNSSNPARTRPLYTVQHLIPMGFLGFCGFNSYCSNPGTKAECHCLPGFAFNNPSEKIRGCSRIFNESMKKEECSKFCLDDCNCGAALYWNGNCYKYKLPIRYGRINRKETATALLKGHLQRVKSANRPPPAPMNTEVKIDGKKTLILVLSLSLGSIAFLCLVIAISSFWVYRHQVWSYRQLSEEVNLGSTEEFTLQSFSYDELEKATDGFREELGRGCYGAVYKGTIERDNKVVAVKRLEKVVEQGEKEFQAEMTAIGQTHHRNLVRLLGFCIEGSRKLLVYEFMRNGSLADLLFNAEKRPIWKVRVRIALELARGILYLHEECESQIVHCDIKPQNILMDDAWTAKISDFGFSKLLMPNQEGIVTGIRGTAGYSAPEWHKNTLISVKADIYSFGVVLLEIVCCRRSIEVKVSTADEIILSSWVYGCLVARELDKLVGDEQVEFKSLERMVKVGLWCVQDDPALRPSMKNVILMLEGTVDIPFPPSPTPLGSTKAVQPDQSGLFTFPRISTHFMALPFGSICLWFYQQGLNFAVGIWLVGNPNNTVVWTANRDDPPVNSNATLNLTKDGKLLLRTDQGEEKLIANATTAAAFASMLDSGNFVLYNEDSDPIWESFSFPTDTILGGQSLRTGLDGNLVLYPADTAHTPGDAYWSTGTFTNGSHLYLNDSRGDLLLRRNDDLGSLSIVLTSSSSINKDANKVIYRATLDVDGVFRLYSHANYNNSEPKITMEKSVLNNACEVKSFVVSTAFAHLLTINPTVIVFLVLISLILIKDLLAVGETSLKKGVEMGKKKRLFMASRRWRI